MTLLTVLRKWIFRLFRISPQVEIVKKSSNTLRLEEWRREKTLTATARKVWSDPDFQMMMDVLKNEHPAWIVLNPSVSNDARAARQGLCEGYTLAIANLEAMRISKTTVELGEPTFEQDERQ